MLIPKPAQSAYENADTDIREMLDRMIAELKATPSWEQRSTQFLEIIDALELAFEGDDEDVDDFDDDEDDEYVGDDDDDAGLDEDDEDDESVEERAVSGEKVNGWHGGGGVVTPANDDGDEVEIVEDFAEVLPFYVGAVLERLGETKLDRPEQAAFYLLSCHPEHTEAAQSWLQQGTNLKRFQKFVDDTPDYEAILEMMDEHYDGADDDDVDEDDED